MLQFTKKAFSLLVLMMAFWTSPAYSQITIEELRSMLSEYNIGSEETESIVNALTNKFSSDDAGDVLDISGVLASKGFNFGFVIDRDSVQFSGLIVSPETGEVVSIPELFTVDYSNPGLKMDISFSIVFLVIPAGMNIESLDGAQFGRGIGIAMEAGIGLGMARMPGKNRPGNLYLFSIGFGIGAGFSFPTMEFQLNRI